MKIVSLMILFAFLFVSESNAQKLTADEVVAKHLASIGTAEKRAEMKSQMILADLELRLIGSSGTSTGKAVIFSTNQKSLWGMTLNAANVGEDKFVYDGKSSKVGFIRPGVRSVLGDLILNYGKLLEESVIGGELSSTWVLTRLDTKKPKLRYEGKKEINGKDTHVLSFTPKGGFEMDVKMFFDAENFHHLRTEYLLIRGAQLGSLDSSAGRDSSRLKIVEDFSDFRAMGDLTLPGTYKISYATTGNSSTQSAQNMSRELEWKFSVTNFSYNQPAEDSTFVLNSK